MTPTELARLAAATSVLRPDWPTASLTTFLSGKYAHRPYRDVAVALTWIACDPATKTPKRLDEAGPWWQAVVASDGPRAPEPPRDVAERIRREAHERGDYERGGALARALLAGGRPAEMERERVEE